MYTSTAFYFSTGHFRDPLCLCSKRVSVRNHSYELTLICMKMKLHAELIFICLTFFETEAQENSEMAYFA